MEDDELKIPIVINREVINQVTTQIWFPLTRFDLHYEHIDE